MQACFHGLGHALLLQEHAVALPLEKVFPVGRRRGVWAGLAIVLVVQPGQLHQLPLCPAHRAFDFLHLVHGMLFVQLLEQPLTGQLAALEAVDNFQAGLGFLVVRGKLLGAIK